MLQVSMQAAPVFAALSQAGAARMINVEAVYEDFLKAMGIEDTERYFISQAPPPVPGQGGQAGGEEGQEGPGGTTAPQSIDPATSPSAQISQSPETLMQRALAARGGGRNV